MEATVNGAQAPKHGRAAFAFIFVTVLLDMLALGIIVPVLPKLIIQFEHGDVAVAARQVGIFAFVWAAMQFYLCAGHGRAVGPLWAQTDRTVVELRLRLRLPVHGPGADVALVVRGPRDLRHHLRKLSNGERIHRRRNPARAACGEVRYVRRGIWTGLRRRTRCRRDAGRTRIALSVLGSRRLEPCECPLWIFHTAGVAT